MIISHRQSKEQSFLTTGPVVRKDCSLLRQLWFLETVPMQDQFCLLNSAPPPAKYVSLSNICRYHFWQRQVLAKSCPLAILYPIQTFKI